MLYSQIKSNRILQIVTLFLLSILLTVGGCDWGSKEKKEDRSSVTDNNKPSSKEKGGSKWDEMVIDRDKWG